MKASGSDGGASQDSNERTGSERLIRIWKRHSDLVFGFSFNVAPQHRRLLSHTYDGLARFLTRLASAKVLVIDGHHLCFASTIRRLDLSVKDIIIMRGHFTMTDNMRPRKSTLVVSNPCVAFPAQTVLAAIIL